MTEPHAAIIEDGIVTNVILADEEFAVSIGATPCGENVSIGWSFDGGEFTAPPPLPPEPVDLIAYASSKRWAIENGGFTFSGFNVATDDRSKLMISGARIKADKDPEFTTRWKTDSGAFITLDAATIIAISDAVLAHVDNCFAIEADVIDAIADGTITTTAQIDLAFE